MARPVHCNLVAVTGIDFSVSSISCGSWCFAVAYYYVSDFWSSF